MSNDVGLMVLTSRDPFLVIDVKNGRWRNDWRGNFEFEGVVEGRSGGERDNDARVYAEAPIINDVVVGDGRKEVGRDEDVVAAGFDS